ncbi:unnamed protein product [Caenorhabditis sp. 36 PRJEB53466]|nr:unnamed protein product [Caenorhabditis sp. 36 PRJEB53466]
MMMDCVFKKQNMEEESRSLHASSLQLQGDEKRRTVDESSVFKLVESRKTMRDDFGMYESRLLFLTQCGYLPVAAAMLMTTFLEPSPGWCENVRNGTARWREHGNQEFYSLSVEHGVACGDPEYITDMTSLLMWGALVGSFFCGLLSDKIGRRPVVIGSLLMVSLGHLLFLLSCLLSWIHIKAIYAFIGFFCGGYMVTNFVIVTEAFELPKSRLMVVSVNGWSFSMAMTAAIAYYTKYWFPYHAIIGSAGLVITLFLYLSSLESCRWLSANGLHHAAKKNALYITLFNDKRTMEEDDAVILKWYEILGFSAPTHTEEQKTWKALFKSITLLKHAAVLCYSFMASSIVSFGFYFLIDVLPGNRYLNMGVMGASKFILGFVPICLNTCISKRTIAVLSVSICCLASVLIVPFKICENPSYHWVIVVLTLIVSAGIDPTWKINHLYSAELFPTSVRSMARGVCNAGGRFGSVMAPLIVAYRTTIPVLPNAVFAALLVIQLIVIVAFLPDDNDKDANEMNDE